MNAIHEILQRRGYESAEEMAVADRETVEVAGMMDLTIEKVRSDRLSVAHYHRQRGDLMRDPMVTFRLEGADPDEWVPIEFQQDPTVYQQDREGLDLDGFPAQWSENLQKQGFVDAAQGGAV